MAGGTCVAGSVKIGERCMFGGQSGVVPHTIIGNDCGVGAQSGVIDNMPDNSSVLGYPAIPHRNFLKSYAVFKKLYDLQKIIYDLQKSLLNNTK
jgi:UDP-3-O-[3-hydroxymyristoyl] glucosamine N-acyltransferase